MTSTIGEIICRLRESRGWTQTELSKRSKLSVSAISQFESSSRTPSYDAIVKLSDALDVSTDTLFGRHRNPDSVASIPEFQALQTRLDRLPHDERKKSIRILKSVFDAQYPDCL